MREIELKFKVDDMNDLLAKLRDMDCEVSEILSQNDTIYVSDLNHVESVEGSIWLRVRKENEKVGIFNEINMFPRWR